MIRTLCGRLALIVLWTSLAPYAQAGTVKSGPSGTPGGPVTGLPSNIIAVAAGGNFGLALDDLGNIWGWGSNSRGQLGDVVALGQQTLTAKIIRYPYKTMPNHPASENLERFRKTAFESSAKAISASGHHCAALLDNGTVIDWGEGSDACGNPSIQFTPESAPPDIRNAGGNPIPLAGIAAGGSHSLAFDTYGNVWGWGSNNRGQIGDANYNGGRIHSVVTDPINSRVVTLHHVTAIAASADNSVALIAPPGDLSSIAHFGYYITPGQSPTATNVKSIALGPLVTIVCHNDNTVEAFPGTSTSLQDCHGGAGYGQNNIPSGFATGTSRINMIAASDYFTIALDCRNRVSGWGHYFENPTSMLNSYVNSNLNGQKVMSIAAGGNFLVALIDPTGTVPATCQCPIAQPPTFPTVGINLWLTASAGVETSPNPPYDPRVTAWRDQTKFHNSFVQSAASMQPTLPSSGGVHFNGLTQWLVCNPTVGPVPGPIWATEPVHNTHAANRTIIAFVRPTALPGEAFPSTPACYPCNGSTPASVPWREWNQRRWQPAATVVGSQSFQMSSGLGFNGEGGMLRPAYVTVNDIAGPPASEYITLYQSNTLMPPNETGGHMIALTDNEHSEDGSTTNALRLYIDDGPYTEPQSVAPQGTANRDITIIGGGNIDGRLSAADFTRASNLFAGDIYEVLVYSEVLDYDKIQQVYQYLRCKWGN